MRRDGRGDRRGRRQGHRARGRRVRRGQVQAAVARLRDAFGPVTIVVNNAGVTDYTPFEEITEELFRLRLQGQRPRPDHRDAGDPARHESGAVGPGSEHLLLQRADRRHQDGDLLLVEGRGHQADPTLAQELGPHGITVNTIPPGSVMGTIMADANISKANAERLAATTAGAPRRPPRGHRQRLRIPVQRGIELRDRSDHRRQRRPRRHLTASPGHTAMEVDSHVIKIPGWFRVPGA